jgi:hypothetical protein
MPVPCARWYCSYFIIPILLVFVAQAEAQTVFPPASPTAADAAAGFDDRAKAVIAFNACSREAEYAAYRAEFAGGNFEHQGEEMGSILIAKAAFLRAKPAGGGGGGGDILHIAAVSGPPCAGRIGRADFPKLTNCVRMLASPDPNAPAVGILIPPDCLERQINETVQAMRKTTVLGSSDLPCIENFSFKSKGEFDVVVRVLVRLLYIAGPVRRERSLLAPETIDHMYAELLATQGPPSDDTYSILVNCGEPAGDRLGSPEDAADRHAWYNEVADAIGDALDWLRTLFFKTAVYTLVTPPALVAAPFLIAAGVDPTDLVMPLPFADVRVPETENHRLMIESSKFLVNADIIDRLQQRGYDHVDDVRADQAKVKDWLLRRLQDIAANDFREYNARPYTRYSLNALLNLHDFAAVHGDTTLQTAAKIVLDLSAAKFAATSNRGRRVPPFRRRSEYDGYADSFAPGGESAKFYTCGEGCDHEVDRAMLLANQTQLLDGGRAPDSSMSLLIYGATSSYRLPAPVLSVAVDRRGPFQQTIRHAGLEHVFQRPAFTITAGGVPTPATASVLGVSDKIDVGVAAPTTIIATVAGLELGSAFRFDGVGMHDKRLANTCVADGFACGVQPVRSDAFGGCTDGLSGIDDELWFVSSPKCFPNKGFGFFLAARFVGCPNTFCEHGRRWGVMDIVERPEPTGEAAAAAFEQFKQERTVALRAIQPDSNGHANYRTAGGKQIEFSLAEREPTVIAVDGVPTPPARTAGDAIDADGQGRATLKGPGGPVSIDFSDFANPRRTP